MILSSLAPELRRRILLWLNVIMGVMGVLSFAALITELGFNLSPQAIDVLRSAVDVIIVFFVGQELLRWLFVTEMRKYLRDRWFENLIALLALYLLFQPNTAHSLVLTFLPNLSFNQLTLGYLAVTQSTIVASLLIKAMRFNSMVAKFKLHPGAIFAISFILIIVVGTGLLMLPRAGVEQLSFIDALFTSTSAVCVTGLIVVDTAAAFTPLGKTILLGLIQIGGLGIMTLTTFFALFFSGGISVRERIMMSTVISSDNIGEVSGVLIRITIFTVVIEAVGALFIYFSMGGGVAAFNGETLLVSVFHSVSAFCNAGFSLYSDGLYDEVVRWNYVHHSIIMFLVVLGGLGVGVLSDIGRLRPWRKNFGGVHNRLSVYTKLVLYTTAILLLLGALLILAMEWNGAMAGLGAGDKVFQSTFWSVTARTAGFNIAPVGELGAPVLFVMIMLMWIGASPASTGGGVKTTTIAVATLNILNTIRGKERVEIFGRHIAVESIRRAFAVVLLSAFLMGASCVTLVALEPNLDVVALIFEVVSAMSTVGLSVGITADLSTGSKALLVAVMFVGRVGILTILFALMNPAHEARYKLPEESVMVG